MADTIIQNRTFDEERALYHLCNATVENCIFRGPADGESAMKESHGLTVKDCTFSLRYPFWHTTDFTVSDSRMEEGCRAALWYCENGKLERCEMHGVKALRECQHMTLSHIEAISPEFGWNCSDVCIDHSDITSEYFLMGSSDIFLHDFTLHGKYSFQYVKNGRLENCRLSTKDAFWHTKNVTVRNSEINGEYLGWYSEGLTLIGCTIRGTQPFCYCKGLTLIDCVMKDADLAFEYSDVSATVSGHIVSVKNPKSGSITADSIGEIIRGNAVMDTDCRIIIRGKQA